MLAVGGKTRSSRYRYWAYPRQNAVRLLVTPYRADWRRKRLATWSRCFGPRTAVFGQRFSDWHVSRRITIRFGCPPCFMNLIGKSSASLPGTIRHGHLTLRHNLCCRRAAFTSKYSQIADQKTRQGSVTLQFPHGVISRRTCRPAFGSFQEPFQFRMVEASARSFLSGSKDIVHASLRG